jgi:hypothetical protein
MFGLSTVKLIALVVAAASILAFVTLERGNDQARPEA